MKMNECGDRREESGWELWEGLMGGGFWWEWVGIWAEMSVKDRFEYKF